MTLPTTGAGTSAGGVRFLLRDEFTTNRAACSVHGTPAEPGPGTRSVQDTGSTLALSGGYMQTSGRVGPMDPSLTLGSLAAQTGRALFALMVIPATGSYHVGWDDATIGWLSNAIFWGNANVGFYVGAAIVALAGLANESEVWGACIQHAGGMVFAFRSLAGTWYLVPSDVAAPNPAYPRAGAYANVPTGAVNALSSLRVADVGGAWANDYGVATQRLAGARSAGDTFVHEANCWLEFTVTTLPAAGQIEVRFRIQDATNYWQVTVDDAGTLDLDEVVAGVVTQRGTSAATITNGETVRVSAIGTTITVRDGYTSKIAYAAAVNFQTETDGELEAEGTGGAVSDIKLWPWIISGAAVAELERYIK